jgi:hypothetical protein
LSLQTLAQLRRQRARPDGVVKLVVVDGVHPAIAARPDVVVVVPGDQPDLMDWRPLVGLPTILLVSKAADLAQAERAFDAAVRAGAAFHGSGWCDLETCTDERAAPLIRKLWDALCQ